MPYSTYVASRQCKIISSHMLQKLPLKTKHKHFLPVMRSSKSLFVRPIPAVSPCARTSAWYLLLSPMHSLISQFWRKKYVFPFRFSHALRLFVFHMAIQRSKKKRERTYGKYTKKIASSWEKRPSFGMDQFESLIEKLFSQVIFTFFSLYIVFILLSWIGVYRFV